MLLYTNTHQDKCRIPGASIISMLLYTNTRQAKCRIPEDSIVSMLLYTNTRQAKCRIPGASIVSMLLYTNTRQDKCRIPGASIVSMLLYTNTLLIYDPVPLQVLMCTRSSISWLHSCNGYIKLVYSQCQADQISVNKQSRTQVSQTLPSHFPLP